MDKAAIDALALLRDLAEWFPGLVDGEAEDDRTGVVEEIASRIAESEAMRRYLQRAV
jgi:hypothetical protein